MVDFLKRNKVLVGVSFFALAIIYVFFPVFGKYSALHAPDAMSFFSYRYRSVTLANVLGGEPFTPYSLYCLLLNPIFSRDFIYVFDTFVLSLAGVYYLKGRGVSAIAAWCGGVALGLSGYTFTIFCAGHTGYFHMISSVMWSFGLLDRGFRTKKVFYFAMLGMVFAWGMVCQPDVFIMVGAVAALYALWLSVISDGGLKVSAVKIWPRFMVMAAFLGIAGFGGIHAALTTQVANRKTQISGVLGSVKSDSAAVKKSDAEVAQEKQAQWLFATNWSMPPEDMLEFVVPGVFGNESVYGPNPYWGRLGQPHKSVFQKGQMMPNYRQHTVYLGVVSVVFALFAVVVWLRKRKEPVDGEAGIESGVYRDVPFWGCVWIVCLILAMGRFTPLYRVFYSIPYMSLIRAPVKFLHLVEVASALLCGFGVHAFLSYQISSVKIRSGLLWITAAVAGLLVVTALVFAAGQSAISEHIKALGMVQYADGAAAYALRNIGRSLIFLAPVAAAAWLMRKANGNRLLPLFGYVVMALIVCDQALVARRYVKSIDLRLWFGENAVLNVIKKETVSGIPWVFNYAPRTQGDWFHELLTYNGVIHLQPVQLSGADAYAQVFNALQKNPVRLWEVLNVKYLILPYDAAGQFVRSGRAKPLLNFEFGSGQVKQSTQVSEKSLVLLALHGVDTKPRLLTQWKGALDVSAQIKQLAESKQVLSDAIHPSVQREATDASVEVLFEQCVPGAYSIGVRARSSAEALLVFNQREDDKYEVLVDGERVEKSVADGIWVAVKLSPGEHKVVLRRKRNALPLLLSLCTMCVMAVWGFFRVVKNNSKLGFQCHIKKKYVKVKPI